MESKKTTSLSSLKQRIIDTDALLKKIEVLEARNEELEEDVLEKEINLNLVAEEAAVSKEKEAELEKKIKNYENELANLKSPARIQKIRSLTKREYDLQKQLHLAGSQIKNLTEENKKLLVEIESLKQTTTVSMDLYHETLKTKEQLSQLLKVFDSQVLSRPNLVLPVTSSIAPITSSVAHITLSDVPVTSQRKSKRDATASLLNENTKHKKQKLFVSN